MGGPERGLAAYGSARDGVRPVFVSVGHRMDLAGACALTLALTPRYRLPETTRAADRACRDALAAAITGPALPV